MNKLLVLEVNEVPFEIFDFYSMNFPSSNIARILGKSTQYTTMSTDQGELHPWSTWPTLYRGVDNSIHGIKDLGEDLKVRDQNYPPVWQILLEKGISTGVFSSLHTYPLPENFRKYEFLVPDPFALGEETHPEKLKPFQSFNLAMSRKSGRTVDTGIDIGKATALLWALPGMGLRFKTIIAILNQLIMEKVSPWKTSRRRSFQSILAFDLFLKQLKKHKPQFTTFFTNHVASAMHRYWAATFPEHYDKNNLPQEWIRKYRNEIPWCMHQLDTMLADILKFIRANPEYKLCIASSMGQAATKAELVEHELFLIDYEKFGKSLGIGPLVTTPAMHPQYNFKSENGEFGEIERILSRMYISGEAVKFRKKEGGFFSLDLGYPNQNINSIEVDGKELRNRGKLVWK